MYVCMIWSRTPVLACLLACLLCCLVFSKMREDRRWYWKMAKVMPISHVT